jgi:hypothetical protein
MAKIARLALIPLTLAAASAWALLGSVGSVKVYPFANSKFDPLSNSVNATVAGVPLNASGVSQTFSDGLPVHDLPGYSDIEKANSAAQSTGSAMMTTDGDAAASAPTN